MIRLLLPACFAVSAVLLLSSHCAAQRKVAYDLIPDSAQAVVWIPDGEKLTEHWQRTRLYDLANDPSVAPFFEEQRAEIENKLVDAGWRLHVKPEDISNYSTGQIALAWMEIPTSPRKPYAMALLADVDDSEVPNKQLLAKIDQEMVNRQAKKTQLAHSGVDIAKYTLPKRAGALLAEETFYAIVAGQFLSTDEEPLIKNLISRIRGESASGEPIAKDPVFVAGREKAAISNAAQIEYFVRPLGLARVLRSIGGKRSKSNADMLAVLQNQGFEAIQCVCGEIKFGLEQLDIAHRGYVLAEQPLPKSAAILDFPNQVTHEIPNFIGKNISSLLATNWNAKVAFWKAEGLVDELAGTPKVFDEVIEGIKLDPNGPRIDIEREVLPFLTNDIYSIADSKQGAPDIDSRRNLIALKLNNSAAMAKVLDRAMKNEPDAELVEFEGHQIWKVLHSDDEEVVDLSTDFGGNFGGPPAAPSSAPEPWLTNWAITVYDDYLMFASHVEMIQDAIVQAKTATASPLLEEQDYLRVSKAINEHFGEEDGSAWQIVRTGLAYQVQYELFREGKLRQSQSMLASILDKLLQTETEMRKKEQRLNGAKLPPYAQIAIYLQPSGLMVRTTSNGWEFGSLLLSGLGQPVAPNPTPQNATLSQGTARVSNSEPEAKR